MENAQLVEAIAQLRVAVETQQAELGALRQTLAEKDQLTAELQAANPIALAAEIRNLVGVLSNRVGSQDDLVDGRGVGQPPRLSRRKDDFAEWTHKTQTFLVAKFGDNLVRILKWAQQQRKTVVSSRTPGEREVSYYSVFGNGAGPNAVANIDAIDSRISTYLTSFTTGDANKIVRNVGPGRGMEAWRRLHAEYDPTSSIRRVGILGQVQNPAKCEKVDELGKALENWLEKKRQYESFCDESGSPCRVSNDSLIAAMYKIMPKSLEESLMLRSDEFDSFDVLFDRLVAYAGTKHSISMKDSAPKQKGPDDMDIDALGGKKGVGKGGSTGGKGPAGGCWHCGGPHYASNCPNPGQTKGGKCKSSGKGNPGNYGGGFPGGKFGGKGRKDPSSYAGKGKGKQNFSSFEDSWNGDSWEPLPEAHESNSHYNPWSHAAHSWDSPVVATSHTAVWGGPAAQATASPTQPEPEADSIELGHLELNTVDNRKAPSVKPPWVVNYNGEDWIKVNYDTGASVTAFPGSIAEGLPLSNIGKDFVVASGGTIPNYGRVRIPIQDERGLRRGMSGSVTDVHKPLGSGSALAKNADTYLWDTGGVIIPRESPVAKGLCEEYHRLVNLYGNRGEIQLHREGGLYNYYVKKVGKAELAPVVDTGPSSATGGMQGPASSSSGAPPRTQQGFPRQGHP